MTESKKEYESDKVLVDVIARRYKILNYLRFDKGDDKIPQNYDCKNDDKNKHKYIATAIEACLGAMYMDENISWEDIVKIVEEWKCIIDSSK